MNQTQAKALLNLICHRPDKIDLVALLVEKAFLPDSSSAVPFPVQEEERTEHGREKEEEQKPKPIVSKQLQRQLDSGRRFLTNEEIKRISKRISGGVQGGIQALLKRCKISSGSFQSAKKGIGTLSKEQIEALLREIEEPQPKQAAE